MHYQSLDRKGWLGLLKYEVRRSKDESKRDAGRGTKVEVRGTKVKGRRTKGEV